MCKPETPRVGAWVAIAVGIVIALLASVGAFGQDRIAVERHGDANGRTVVFIPGLATPGGVFEPYIRSRAGLDAHLVTLAGFGGVPALDPAGGVMIPSAEAVAAYLQQGGYDDIVLVGHSLGGQIALHVATRLTDRVSHVVVVDSLPFFPGLMNPDADPAMVRARGEAMAPALAAMERGAFMTMIEQGAPVQATSAEHQAQVVDYVAQSDQATVAQAMFEALSLDWRAGLGAVRAPVTLMVPHNAFIGLTPQDLGARYEAQYHLIETLDVQLVADSRHFVMLDQPERFAERLNLIIGDLS